MSELDQELPSDELEKPNIEYIRKRVPRWWLNSAPLSYFLIHLTIVNLFPVLVAVALGASLAQFGQLLLMSWLSIGGIPLAILAFNHFPWWVYYLLAIIWTFTLFEFREIAKPK